MFSTFYLLAQTPRHILSALSYLYIDFEDFTVGKEKQFTSLQICISCGIHWIKCIYSVSKSNMFILNRLCVAGAVL